MRRVTARDLLELVGRHPLALAGLFVVLPAAVLVLGVLHGAGGGGRAPWRFFYAVIVYLACVPGIGAAVITAYTLFFTRENLLDKNLLVYVVPIVSMALTLLLIRKRVPFDDIPGFHRIWGLMTLIAVTFVILLVIHKTFIGIFFAAPIAALFTLGAFLFALLKWGSAALLGEKKDPPGLG
jgi:hypothetical protein